MATIVIVLLMDVDVRYIVIFIICWPCYFYDHFNAFRFAVARQIPMRTMEHNIIFRANIRNSWDLNYARPPARFIRLFSTISSSYSLNRDKQSRTMKR